MREVSKLEKVWLFIKRNTLGRIRWCTVSFSKKGPIILWDWCVSVWSDDFDSGEAYSLFNIVPDWWKKSFSEAWETKRSTIYSIVLPAVFAYPLFGIQTLKDYIHWRKSYKRSVEDIWDYPYDEVIDKNGNIKES